MQPASPLGASMIRRMGGAEIDIDCAGEPRRDAAPQLPSTSSIATPGSFPSNATLISAS